MSVKRLAAAVVAAGCLSVLAVSFAPPAHADDRDRHGAPPHPRGFDHRDTRYNRNEYYPSRGYVSYSLPRDRYSVSWRGGARYYYSGGIWYEPRGPRYVVVGAPIGAFVPVLPGFYTSLWIGGTPYYYANDTYYVYRDSQRGYEVVDPPDDRDARFDGPPPGAAGGPPDSVPPGAAPGPAPKSDMFIYPKNGQSADKQSTDKYECHKWAQGESGFDPTASGGGVPPEQNAPKRADYNRAMTACLEGRGYSVR